MTLKVPKTASTRLQLPYSAEGEEPPAAEPGTLSFAPETDTVRVQTSTGWEDVGSGGSGTVTEIDSPDGSITVTNPAGPTVSLEVDPTNVIVSGQVTGPLSATSVIGITETSGPTALTIGAIPDARYLSRSGSTVVGIPLNSASGILNSQPVGTPDSRSDEFNSGTSDLGARGWTVINAFSGATMTRIGDISNTISPSGMAANQYRSTITGSGICIQCSGEMYCYKTISTAGTFVARGGVARGSTTTIYCTPLQLTNGVLPITNSTQRWFCNIYNGTIEPSRMLLTQVYSNMGWSSTDQFLDTFLFRPTSLTGTPNLQPFAAYSTLDRWLQGAAGAAGQAVSGTISTVGFSGATNLAADAYTQYFFIRYFRFFSATSAPPLI